MPKKIAALLFVCLCFLPLQSRGDDDLAKLGKARLDAAAKAYKGWFDSQPTVVSLGGADYSVTYELSVRWLHAELDLAAKKEERIAGYDAHLQRMKDWAKLGDSIPKGKGKGRDMVLAIIDATEKEAVYWLAKERARK